MARVPEVVLTKAFEFLSLMKSTVVPEVAVNEPPEDATNTLDAVVEELALEIALPWYIFSASDAVVELDVAVAEPFCTLTPETEATDDVADTIVCKSASSYSLLLYRPEP